MHSARARGFLGGAAGAGTATVGLGAAAVTVGADCTVAFVAAGEEAAVPASAPGTAGNSPFRSA